MWDTLDTITRSLAYASSIAHWVTINFDLVHAAVFPRPMWVTLTDSIGIECCMRLARGTFVRLGTVTGGTFAVTWSYVDIDITKIALVEHVAIAQSVCVHNCVRHTFGAVGVVITFALSTSHGTVPGIYGTVFSTPAVQADTSKFRIFISVVNAKQAICWIWTITSVKTFIVALTKPLATVCSAPAVITFTHSIGAAGCMLDAVEAFVFCGPTAKFTSWMTFVIICFVVVTICTAPAGLAYAYSVLIHVRIGVANSAVSNIRRRTFKTSWMTFVWILSIYLTVRSSPMIIADALIHVAKMRTWNASNTVVFSRSLASTRATGMTLLPRLFKVGTICAVPTWVTNTVTS